MANFKTYGVTPSWSIPIHLCRRSLIVLKCAHIAGGGVLRWVLMRANYTNNTNRSGRGELFVTIRFIRTICILVSYWSFTRLTNRLRCPYNKVTLNEACLRTLKVKRTSKQCFLENSCFAILKQMQYWFARTWCARGSMAVFQHI